MTLSKFEARYADRELIGNEGDIMVFKAYDPETHRYVVIKESKVKPESKQLSLYKEAEIINNLPWHPNVAQYDSYYRLRVDKTEHVDVAVMKYYETGNLEQLLSDYKLKPVEIQDILTGILEGVGYLHDNHIIHTNLNLKSILIGREDGVWVPVISGFHHLMKTRGEFSAQPTEHSSFSFLAPEQIKNLKINKNVDIWSIGVLIYRIVTGELPFVATPGQGGGGDQSQASLAIKIANLMLPEKYDTIEEPYHAMIKRCLVINSKARAQSAGEVLAIMNGKTSSLANIFVLPGESNPSKITSPRAARLAEGIPISASKRNMGVIRSLLLWLILPSALIAAVYSFSTIRKPAAKAENTGELTQQLAAPSVQQSTWQQLYTRSIEHAPSEDAKNNYSQTFFLLAQAALIAIQENKTLEMRQMMSSDNSGTVKKLEGLFSWKAILTALEKNDIASLEKIWQNYSKVAPLPNTPTVTEAKSSGITSNESVTVTPSISNPTPTETVLAPASVASTPVNTPVETPAKTEIATREVKTEPISAPKLTEAVEGLQATPKASNTEKAPRFPGGASALSRFIVSNIRQPNTFTELEGNVVVEFDVNEDGSISNAQVIEKLGTGYDEEALRVVKKMPKLIPGQRNGVNAKMKLSQTIRFQKNN